MNEQSQTPNVLHRVFHDENFHDVYWGTDPVLSTHPPLTDTTHEPVVSPESLFPLSIRLKPHLFPGVTPFLTVVLPINLVSSHRSGPLIVVQV